MNDQTTERHCGEGEGEDSAELVAGIELVRPLARGSMVVVHGGVNGWQVPLRRFEFRSVEVAREDHESIAPPGGCSIGQRHDGQAFASIRATRTVFKASCSLPSFRIGAEPVAAASGSMVGAADRVRRNAA